MFFLLRILAASALSPIVPPWTLTKAGGRTVFFSASDLTLPIQTDGSLSPLTFSLPGPSP